MRTPPRRRMILRDWRKHEFGNNSASPPILRRSEETANIKQGSQWFDLDSIRSRIGSDRKYDLSVPIVVHETIALGCTIKRRSHRQCGCRLVSKQAAVASVVFVHVQTTLLDHLSRSSQRRCDGRIANVWQRLDED